MKTNLKNLSIVLFTSLMFACDKTNVSSVPLEQAKPKVDDESVSAISQIEKDKRIAFFKNDVQIKDESGGNEIVMRFAALDKKALDSYLEDFEFSIKAIYKKENSKLLKTNITKDESAKDNSIDNSIFTEVISQKLANGVSGLVINVKFIGKKDKNARPYYNYHASHVSSAWSEILHVAVFDNPVQYWVDLKNCGWCGWYTGAGPVQQNPSTEINWDIDGPKYAKLEIDFDDYINYSFWFENY